MSCPSAQGVLDTHAAYAYRMRGYEPAGSLAVGGATDGIGQLEGRTIHWRSCVDDPIQEVLHDRFAERDILHSGLYSGVDHRANDSEQTVLVVS